MAKNTKVLIMLVWALFAANQAIAESVSTSSSTWDGLYIGIDAGASKGNAEPTVNAKEAGYFITTDPGQTDPEASHDMDATNFISSLFLGLNHQIGNIVIGLEADVSLDNYNEKYSSGDITYLTQPTATFSVSTKVESNWAFSVRPRFGYAFKKSLLYISGGPSIRKFDYDFTFSDTFGPEYAHINSSKWKIGWIAGVGYERKMRGNWSLRAEYFYSSYNKIIDTQSSLKTNSSDGFTHKLDFAEHSFRIGLSMQF